MSRDGGRLRQTLAKSTALFHGVGLHSGAGASVCIHPGFPSTGLIFLDSVTGQEIPAAVANVTDTSRCTRLGLGGSEVQTVEHLLSALAGLEVDDALIETRGGEIPAGDGSAAPFAALILAAGVRAQEQGLIANPLSLERPWIVSGDHGALLVALPAKSLSVTVVLDYPEHSYIGTQAAAFDAVQDDYAVEIAPARTYGFLKELDWLHTNGLALGASRDNAVVLGEDGYETPLRFSEELARHKLLDLIGDLALLGQPLHAQVFAVKPSHALNVRLVNLLATTIPAP